MNKNAIQYVMNRKTAQVVHVVSNMFNIKYDTAFYMFCSSDTYRKLSDIGTRYWCESIPYIVESFVAEKDNKPINDAY